MAPRFIYLDLGRVLLDFTVERMCRQVAEVAAIPPADVHEAIFGDGLQTRYELGEISTREFYDAFCERTATRPDFDRLTRAAGDIFDLKPGMMPMVVALHRGGHRLGILSNTCESHWEHVCRRFADLVAPFSVHALSYRIRAAKPDAAIFRAAAKLAGVEPAEIFFADDTAGHVAAARAAGFDAVQFTSTELLRADLGRRGMIVPADNTPP